MGFGAEGGGDAKSGRSDNGEEKSARTEDVWRVVSGVLYVQKGFAVWHGETCKHNTLCGGGPGRFARLPPGHCRLAQGNLEGI